MITIDQKECIGCGTCVRVCLPGQIRLKENVATFIGDDCLKCGHCAGVCPVNAVKVDGWNDTVVSYDDLGYRATTSQLLSLIRSKRSTREFKTDKISHEDIETILQAAKYTATAKNLRTMKFVVLEGNLQSLALRAVQALQKNGTAPIGSMVEKTLNGEDGIFFNAPTVILVADKITKDFEGNNAYLAASKMELVAETLGIGSCYIGFFARALLFDEELKKDVGIDEDYKVYAVLALGYPDVEYLRTVERPALDVKWLKFDEE